MSGQSASTSIPTFIMRGVTGSGAPGYGGDNGGTVKFQSPVAVAVDSSATLFLSDSNNDLPAQPGETIVPYVIGFGPVLGPPAIDVAAGQTAPAASALEAPFQFSFAGTSTQSRTPDWHPAWSGSTSSTSWSRPLFPAAPCR